MPKDSQIDPKKICKEKLNANSIIGGNEQDNESRNTKKQSGNKSAV